MTARHALLRTTPRKVCFAGDWHGDLNWAADQVNSAAAQQVDLILHVGDFGYWHGHEGTAYIAGLDKVCRRTGVPILWIDGNHEAFDQLQTEPCVDGLTKITEHIWHIPRGTRWEWGDLRFGGLGGATSVDAGFRADGSSWWPQEALTIQDVAAWLDGGPVDVAITHDAPAGFAIPGNTHADGVSLWGHDAILAAEMHRETLAEALEPTSPTLVVHGHYHVRHTSTWRCGSGSTRVVGLDCDDCFPRTNNVWVATLDEIADIVTEMRS